MAWVLSSGEINDGLLENDVLDITGFIKSSGILRYLDEILLKPIVVSIINHTGMIVNNEALSKLVVFLENTLGNMKPYQILLLAEKIVMHDVILKELGGVLVACEDDPEEVVAIISKRRKHIESSTEE